MSDVLEYHDMIIGGLSLSVSGFPSDAYFQTLDDFYANNISLCQVIWTDLKPGSVILDVGANIGVTSTLFNRIVRDAAVYSFEPSPKAHRCLVETLKRNNIRTDRAFQHGMGAKSGSFKFHEGAMLAGSRIIASKEDEDFTPSNITIKVKSIDEFVKEQKLQKLDFIKIDVEGFEEEVLIGAKRTLATLKPKVFIEFNSYSLIEIRNENPRLFLKKLVQTFPSVMWWDGSEWKRVKSSVEQHLFMHENLMKHACVSDLLCSF